MSKPLILSRTGGVATETIFGNATPGTIEFADGSSYTFGLKFKSSVNGTITGIRFYRGPDNAAPHTIALYPVVDQTTAQTPLASKVTSGETSTGWQNQLFDTPIGISANVIYQAAVLMPLGEYSFDAGMLASDVVNGHLTAIADGTSGLHNMSFHSGATLTWPETSGGGNFYWVDVLFQAANFTGTQYYVRTDGADTNAGTSDSASGAWKTMQKAANVMVAGDTCNVGPGTYSNGFQSVNAGSAGNPITFRPTQGTGDWSNSGIVITGFSTAGGQLSPVWISHSYITVQGFAATSGTSKGNFQVFNGAVGVKIQHCRSYGGGNQWGIKATDVSSLTIENCQCEDSAGEHGIYVSGTDGYTIRGCVCFGNNWDGIHTNVDDGSNQTNTNGLIEKNICHTNSLSGMDLTGINHSTIQNNLCYANDRHGIVVQNSNGNPTYCCHDNVFANNSLDASLGSSAYGIEFAAPSAQPVDTTWTTNDQNTTVFNNAIIANTSAGNGTIGDLGTVDATFKSDYNAVVNQFRQTATDRTLAAWQSNTGEDANSVIFTAATLWTNSAGGDYTILSGATPPGSATFNSISAPADDITGATRSSFRAGCYA